MQEGMLTAWKAWASVTPDLSKRSILRAMAPFRSAASSAHSACMLKARNGPEESPALSCMARTEALMPA